MCSKSTINAPEQRQQSSGVFFVNFEIFYSVINSFIGNFENVLACWIETVASIVTQI